MAAFKHNGLIGGGVVPPPVARATTYAWFVLGVLIACYGVYNLDKSIISVVLEPVKRRFLLNDSSLGLLTGLTSTIPFALTCIPLGMMADRVRRVRLLVFLIVVWSLMTAAAGFAQTALLLYVSRMGVGAAEAGFPPTSMSLVSDYFPRRQRATALGMFGLGAPLGILLGMGVGGYVVQAWGWRVAFFISGLPGILFAAVVAFGVDEPVRQVDSSMPTSHPRFFEIVRFVFAHRPMLHVILGMLLSITPIAAIAVWLPSFVIRMYALNARTAGAMSALIFGVFGTVGATLSGIVGDHLGKVHEERKLWVPIAGTMFAIAFGLVGASWAPTPLWAILTLGPCAFFTQSITGVGYATISTLAPASIRAAALAVLLVSINLISYGLGAQSVGIISDHFTALNPARSLGIGIAATFVFSAWGVFHFWLAKRLLTV